jgi:hypothetical protein
MLKSSNGAKIFCVTLAFFIVACSFAFAQGKGHNKNKTQAENVKKGNSIQVTIFSEQDRGTIREYWVKQPGGLPPGLAKRQGDLPPGLEKQLQRNGHLPPGLEKKIASFPPDLERRLPSLPSEYRRVICGNIGIILKNTNIVVDFFDMSR